VVPVSVALRCEGIGLWGRKEIEDAEEEAACDQERVSNIHPSRGSG